MAFQKATKEKAKLRLAISGPSGAGKTKTALRIAKEFGRVAVLDSENGSSAKYADEHDFEIDSIDQSSHPSVYEKAIKEAEDCGFDILIIDSLTPAWDSTKDEVDKKKAADKFGNGFTAWKVGSDLWKSLIKRIESSSIHIIVTMRAKVEYQPDVENGKKIVRKLGMAPEIRDGTEYVFDAVLEMEVDHSARIGKTRCSSLDGFYEIKPGEGLAHKLIEWLSSGVDSKKRVVSEPTKEEIERIEAIRKTIGIAKSIGFSETDFFEILKTNSIEKIEMSDVINLSNCIRNIDSILKLGHIAEARKSGLVDEDITEILQTDDWESASKQNIKRLCDAIITMRNKQ